MSPETAIIEPFYAIAVQGNWEKYNPDIRGRLEGETFRRRNLQRMLDYIDACFGPGGHPLPARLICFPEFSFGGIYNLRTTAAEVREYECVAIPGPETDALAEKAKKYNVYIAAANHEADPTIPELHFNTAFIINPAGKIILKYRKLNVAFGVNPHDIHDKYVNPVTGKPDFFPVVETKIGRLACYIGGDVLIPEIPRMLAAKGADIICHLTSGNVGGSKQILRVRALDNTVYIVGCNWASMVLGKEALGQTWAGTAYDSRGGGGSVVIDFNGNILAEAEDKTPQVVGGKIDIMALRQARNQYRNPALGTGDALAMCRTELYRPLYDATVFPPNSFVIPQAGPAESGGGAARTLFPTKPFDAALAKRRAEAVANRQKLYDFYPESSI